LQPSAGSLATKAIEELGAALEKVGRRREAATVHISFSATCPGHYAPSLRSAVNILLTPSDYAQAASVASRLIALEPFNDNGYYLRAVANDRAGLLKQAIDDYVTAIELFGKSPISGWRATMKSSASSAMPCCRSNPGLRSIQRVTTPARREPSSRTIPQRATARLAPRAARKSSRLRGRTASQSCRSASTACRAV
jgi:tetratricopeptide (TPR) repeat protein